MIFVLNRVSRYFNVQTLFLWTHSLTNCSMLEFGWGEGQVAGPVEEFFRKLACRNVGAVLDQMHEGATFTNLGVVYTGDSKSNSLAIQCCDTDFSDIYCVSSGHHFLQDIARGIQKYINTTSDAEITKGMLHICILIKNQETTFSDPDFCAHLPHPNATQTMCNNL